MQRKSKKIMLHIIMPNQVSGPNTSAKRIANSYLNKKYEFEFVVQEFHAKGKINIKLIKELTNQIKSFDPDIIHLSGLQSSGFHAVVAAKLAGCKNIIITIRGFSGDAIEISKVKKYIFTNIIEPLTIRLCDKFYLVCEESYKKKMINKNRKKCLGVIHNAAPEITFNVEETRKKMRNELGINKDDFLVVISGRMVYDKGISFISEAIKKINEKNIKFLFIGDGPYYDFLLNNHEKEIIENRVIMLGQRKDVLELLSGADLFLFATLHENLSNALLEAMAIGLPVVATSVGGNKEVVNHEKNGYLIPPKNVDAIVSSIKKISNDKELHNLFSYESKKIIQNRFSQDVVYQKVEEIYKELD